MFTLVLSGYTLRYDQALLLPEIAATLPGTFFVLGAAWAMRYLRTPRHGITAEADGEQHFNLGSLIVAQTAHAPGQPPADGFAFDGDNRVATEPMARTNRWLNRYFLV